MKFYLVFTRRVTIVKHKYQKVKLGVKDATNVSREYGNFCNATEAIILPLICYNRVRIFPATVASLLDLVGHFRVIGNR